MCAHVGTRGSLKDVCSGIEEAFNARISQLTKEAAGSDAWNGLLAVLRPCAGNMKSLENALSTADTNRAKAKDAELHDALMEVVDVLLKEKDLKHIPGFVSQWNAVAKAPDSPEWTSDEMAKLSLVAPLVMSILLDSLAQPCSQWASEHLDSSVGWCGVVTSFLQVVGGRKACDPPRIEAWTFPAEG